MQNLSKQNWVLHLLRALFALLVVLSHFKGFYFQKLDDQSILIEKILRIPFSLGYFAVIGFFVISGYLVGGNALSSSVVVSTRGFVFNRITRLWTVAIPSLCLTFFSVNFVCGNYSKAQFCTGAESFTLKTSDLPMQSLSLTTFLGNLFFLQDFQVPVYGANGPLWSLAFEFWYYMAFIAVYNMLKFREKSLVIILASAFFILVVVQIVSPKWYILGFSWVVGAFSRKLVANNLARKVKVVNFSFLIFLVAFPTIITLSAAIFVPEFLGVLLVTIVTCIIIIYFSSLEVVVNGKISSFLCRLIFELSNSSFSLYAYHFPLLVLIANIYYGGTSQRFTVVSVLNLICVVPMVYFMCYLFFLLTEKNTGSVRKYFSAKFKLQ